MKKIAMLLPLFLLSAALFTGCGKTPEDEPHSEENTALEEAWTATEAALTATETLSTPPEVTQTPAASIKTSEVLLYDISTCYSLFPIAFSDSNGDGLGDINGIREKLSYLKYDLGVDCIWINPIHPSPSYHKYDVVDYKAVDSAFGTMKDYENLIAEMHGLDMYLMMDFVINHTSIIHPWFQAALSGDENYRDYYRWLTEEEMADRQDKSGWHMTDTGYYYGGFSSEMPELNIENEKVRQELKSIAGFWLEKGVDGFRIDAAMHLYDKSEYPEGFDIMDANVGFFIELSEYIKSIDENAFIISEVWTDFRSASPYYEGMDALFNFDIGEAVLNAAYVGSKDIADTIEYYNEQMAEYDNRVMGTFLSNHDQNRSIEALARSSTRAKVAANLLFTLPGIPFVYYGEEIGMAGKKPDENIREPFLWSEDSEYNTAWNPFGNNVNEKTVPLDAQMVDADSLYNVYKNMIRVRKENPVLKNGGIMEVDTGVKAVIAYTRFDENANVLIIHNTLDREIAMNIILGSGFGIIYAQDEENTVTEGVLHMSGRSVIIIDLQDNGEAVLSMIN